jgi:hypothetical protein
MALLTTVLAACAGCTPASTYPAFRGRETESWIAYEETLPERDPSDLLPAFEASARTLGCSTEQLGYESDPNVAGEMRQMYGISATCDEGTIALVTLVGSRVRIGCTKPMTRDRCDTLLRKISEAR